MAKTTEPSRTPSRRRTDCGLRALESDITIKDVPQPERATHVAAVAAISGNGPDLAVMWTGIYDLQYALPENLKGNVPAAT